MTKKISERPSVHGWLPAAHHSSARAPSARLAERMAGTSNEPAADSTQMYRPTPEPPVIIDLNGKRSFHTVEKKLKRQRPGLTQGMRARLLGLIAQARAAGAESLACSDRRQELIRDLMKAKQLLHDCESQVVRRAWMDGRTVKPEYQEELKARSERVARLTAGVDAVTAQQTAAAQRSGRLKDICQQIGNHSALGKRQAIWGDTDQIDLQTLEERLLGQ
jgi:hypothetical protein